MNRIIVFVALFIGSLSLFLATGCTTSEKQVTFKETQLIERGGPCETDTASCIDINLRYVLLEPADDTAFSKINSEILDAIKASLTFEKNEGDSTSLEGLARQSIEEFGSILREYPDQQARWTIESALSVLYNNGRLLCIRIDEYTFLGGAHPNEYTNLMTFDLQTGSSIEASSFIEDHTAFHAYAERVFRQKRELSQEENLNDAGYFWNQPFTLPEQMGLTPEGLLLFYNNYEVAPYAAGPTELVLNWQDIKQYLRPEAIQSLHPPESID